jgi:hypothetical protein
MQSAKSGVSRVLGLPAKLISVPEATIRGCHVLTVTLLVPKIDCFKVLFKVFISNCIILYN